MRALKRDRGSKMKKPKIPERISKIREKVTILKISRGDIWKILTGIPFLLALLVLFSILYILFQGLDEISLEFLFTSVVFGGILEGIVGTFMLFAGTLMIATPIGVGAAIYLEKFVPQDSKLIYVINQSLNNLAGVPSVVIGLFGLTLFVRRLGLGISLISGWLTLTLMAFPIIVKGSREAIDDVPESYEEAAIALGASKWQAVRDNTLPVAAPGIITSAILALVRVAGETAAILFTASVATARGVPTLFEPVISLTYYLYYLLAESPEANATQQAFGVAFILFCVVLVFEALAFILRLYFRRKMSER